MATALVNGDHHRSGVDLAALSKVAQLIEQRGS